MSANILTSLSCKNVNVVSNLVTKLSSRLGNVRLSSTVADAAKPASNVSETQPPPEKKINRAMLAYLERAKAHDSFILKEKTDFQIGKRHLANMMGENPETFTQDDIDRAIEYLFPSGLFDKAARPIMKPPEEIFPPKKAAEFDLTGRPFHFLFYTTRPQYYEMLYTMVEEMQKLNAIEDDMISQNVAPKEKLDMGASDWMTHLELEKFLIENVDEKHYEYFLSTAKRLAEHPWAFMAKDTIMKYRASRTSLIQSFDIPDVEYDAEGRPFITVSDCMRKTARGEVTVKGKGSGKITVNGKPMYIHFPRAQDREQIIFPLQFTKLMDQVDVEAKVKFGGPTGQSGCIRWGIAWALRSFVDRATLEKMRIAGLLTRDWRRRERKKPGQEGARRKFTWKAR